MDALEQVIRGAYQLGALSASEAGQAHLRRARLAAVAGHDLGAGAGRGDPHPRGRRLALRAAAWTARPRHRRRITCDWRDGDVW